MNGPFAFVRSLRWVRPGKLGAWNGPARFERVRAALHVGGDAGLQARPDPAQALVHERVQALDQRRALARVVARPLVAEVAEHERQRHVRVELGGPVRVAERLVDGEEVVGEAGGDEQRRRRPARGHVVGGVEARQLLDGAASGAIGVGLAGARAGDPAGDVGLRVGPGRGQVAHRPPRHERLAGRLPRPDRELRRGEDRVDDGGLLDPNRLGRHRAPGDPVDRHPPVRRGGIDEVGPGDHGRGGRDVQALALRRAPRLRAAVGQHHPVAERRQHQRLPAAVGVAGDADAAVVDEAASRRAAPPARACPAPRSGRRPGGCSRARRRPGWPAAPPASRTTPTARGPCR